jgi:hypothetical protein
MKWQKWGFEPGERYLLSEVIGACNDRLRDGYVIRRDNKASFVQEMEKCGHTTVVWSPKADRGWGASAFNKEVLAHH